MPTLAATKRQQALTIQLLDILHEFLLAVDSLHVSLLADITDNLSVIQKATIECYRIQIDYKVKYER